MKKTISVLIALCLMSLLSLSFVGCMDRAMAPKEEKTADTSAPAPAPAAEQTPAAPATK